MPKPTAAANSTKKNAENTARKPASVPKPSSAEQITTQKKLPKSVSKPLEDKSATKPANKPSKAAATKSKPVAKQSGSKAANNATGKKSAAQKSLPEAQKARGNESAAKATAGVTSKKPLGGPTTNPAKYKKAGKSKTVEVVQLVPAPAAMQMMDLLCQRYPDAECELTYKNDFELLTSVILSAQTTDAQVNKVTPKLFAQFPNPTALAEADIDEIKQIIRPTGYFNAKAKSIQDCAKGIVTKFGGTVPKTLEELVTLPGVGRKTANVVLGVLHGESAWTVDTHVQRLSHRLGFTTEEDPYKIELALQKLFPVRDWSKASITLIWHGRRTCFAKNPNCPDCPINHLCPSSTV